MRNAHAHTRGVQWKLAPFDVWLLVGIVIILVIGLLMVYNSSVAISIRDFGHPYHFLAVQLRWLGIGIILMFLISRIKYTRWKSIALPFILVTVGLLIAVFLPGIGVGLLGANRWINLGWLSFQPSQLAKLSLIIYLAAWLSKAEKNRSGAFFLLVGTLAGLIVIEPDLGTAVVVVIIGVVMYFVSGAPLRQLVGLLIVFLIMVGLLSVAAPYRLRRVTTFLDPMQDPLGSSYQIRQVLLALGSGGWRGVGLGNSRQKYEYIPEVNTDAIFAIVGEEGGFIGGSILIGLFIFVASRGLRIAQRAEDSFGRLVAFGITTWITSQALINMSVNTALLPFTGITLPFISYGGSSLVVMLIAVGLLLSISRGQT